MALPAWGDRTSRSAPIVVTYSLRMALALSVTVIVFHGSDMGSNASSLSVTMGLRHLGALRWLADQSASLTFLDRRGKVLFVTGPTASSDARMRRAQAVASQSGAALLIVRELISRKLAGQEQVVRDKLFDSATAQIIARFRAGEQS
jgi:hypothetical protein